MGSVLMYELLAAERAALYRAETEHDRQLRLLAAEERRRAEAARASGQPRRPRRALAAALLGFATFGALGPRRGTR